MYMVTKPKIYDVIVTTNMFGDIITDLGAAIQGGMGMAASGNLNPTRQDGQHVRAGARQRAGHRRARVGRTRSRRSCRVAMMLDFLEPAAGGRGDQRTACQTAVADPENHTRDLGGTANTSDIGDAVAVLVRG